MSNIKFKYNGKSYEAADAFMGEETFKEVGYMTYMERTTVTRALDGLKVSQIQIVHHNTTIVVYEKGKKTKIYSGGYRSRTTKDRIHHFTGCGLHQKNGEWFLQNGEPFYDGIEV